MNTRKILMAFAIAASTLSMNAHAGLFDVTPKVYGTQASADSAQRTIEVNADTKAVHVTNGEIVTFKINGQRFTWKFDLYHQEGVVDLSFLAPKEMHADGVKVYVAENPVFRELYRN